MCQLALTLTLSLQGEGIDLVPIATGGKISEHPLRPNADLAPTARAGPRRGDPAGRDYHRMWGAARHDRATGIHRLLFGDVRRPRCPRRARRGFPPGLYLDGVGLAEGQGPRAPRPPAEVSDVPASAPRSSIPTPTRGADSGPTASVPAGGELIEPYLAQLAAKLAAATGKR